MATTEQSINKLNKYTERLELLNKQLENVNKNTKEYKRLTKEKSKVEEKAIKASKELAEAQGKLSSTLPTHKRLIDQSNAAQKRFNNTTEKASKVTKGFFGRLKTAIGTLTRYATAYALINAAQRLFTELVVNSAKRSIQLEKAFADLSAIANLTAKDINRLESVVFKVAGTTSLTAVEVVELQKQLAKLGTSVGDIENLTRPIALLSQALGEDAGGVAATLKKTLNQFQATSEEADRFSNALVGAINESALSLKDLSTALGLVGPLAAQSGLSFEQTASLLGVLADNGFRASRAGTGLRNILNQAARDGRPINEFLEELSTRNLDVAEATEIFTVRGAAAAITISQNAERIAELNEELKDNTRLLKANAKQMSSTQGQIDLLSSAYNRASIRLGEFIINTEFFLELIELLDPSVAGQARAFKVIATASEETSGQIDALTTSLVDFKDTTEEAAISTSQELFNILESSGNLTEKQVETLQEKIDAGDNLIETLRDWASQGVPGVDDQLLLAEGLVELTAERAKVIRDERIAVAAKNENYKEAVALTNELTDAAGRGVLVDKEQERVSKGLEDKIKALQTLREGSSDKEEIIILEKRIALFDELAKKVDNLENSQVALDDTEKKRIKDSLSNSIEAIKNQEKVIAGLPEGISDNIYFKEVDVLNELFGDLESIKKAGLEKFGKDSEFVKFITDLFQGALNESSVALKVDPFGDIILDTSAFERFDETYVDGVEKIRNLKTQITEAFRDVALGDIIGEGLDRAAEAISSFNDVALENTQQRLDAEKSAIANRYETENDILKSQLDNQLITESQFRAKQRELQKAKIAEENAIERQLFESEKKRDRQNATTDYLQAIASIIPTLIAYDKTADPVSVLTKAAITGGFATASYGAELAAIGQKKFVPKKFAYGGVVNGPSHDQGGVPFSVQGNSGYEMEGGEYIINKRATSMHKDLLDRINKSGMTRPQVGRVKYAQGGLVSSPLNESVDYLKAIAEATTSTAIGVSKPVRAFVSSSDLRTNENERRLRDRNDRI